MKKWQMISGIAVALVIALGLTVAAFAQGGTPPANAPQDWQPGTMGRGGMAGGQGPMAGYGMRFGANGSTLVDVTADVTGLSVTDVVAELQAGQTFAQVAEAHGKTASDLVTAFLAERETALDQAVADGRITQETADTMLATMRANVEEHVNGTWQPRGMGYRLTGQQPAQSGTQFGGGPRWNR
jgi:hypothetical protein